MTVDLELPVALPEVTAMLRASSEARLIKKCEGRSVSSLVREPQRRSRPLATCVVGRSIIDNGMEP
jgi:hypothetical protein